MPVILPTTLSVNQKNARAAGLSISRITIYCGAEFDAKKNILAPAGFVTSKYVKRSNRVEWEHVVLAENFGRAFSEWRDGHKSCVDSKGKSFKGRKCAGKSNTTYRYMQADMHNFFPAIGAVNALRSNYNRPLNLIFAAVICVSITANPNRR